MAVMHTPARFMTTCLEWRKPSPLSRLCPARRGIDCSRKCTSTSGHMLQREGRQTSRHMLYMRERRVPKSDDFSHLFPLACERSSSKSHLVGEECTDRPRPRAPHHRPTVRRQEVGNRCNARYARPQGRPDSVGTSFSIAIIIQMSD